MKILKHAFLSIAAATVLCAAPMARADILGTQGFAAGSQAFGLNIGPSTVSAGGFTGTWNAQSIIFWCIELTQNFSFNNNYSDYVAAPEPDNAVMTLLGQLFTEAYPSALQNSTYSAAFQLAIWEIIYDSGSMNLASGSLFVKDNHGNTDAIGLAQGWLDHLTDFTDNYHLFLLTSPTRQDFVTFGKPFRQQVPEPASVILLAAAFLAMSVALRRRPRRVRA